MHEMNSVIDTE